VKFSSADLFRNGKCVGTFPVGFDLNVSSILGQAKASNVWQDLSPAKISIGFVRRLYTLLTFSMTLVVRKQIHYPSGKCRDAR